MKTVYCIPGLGTDHRIFDKLDLDADVKFLDFIEPQTAEEPVSHYCKRLIENIEESDLDKELVLIGYSLGGIVSIEVSKLLPNPPQVILINSIKSAEERPLVMSAMGWLPAYRMIPNMLSKSMLMALLPFLGRMPQEDFNVAMDMWLAASNTMIRWGVQTIFTWQHNTPVPNLTHIHGDKDMVFPIENIKEPQILRGGNHVMIGHYHHLLSHMINQLLVEGKQPRQAIA